MVKTLEGIFNPIERDIDELNDRLINRISPDSHSLCSILQNIYALIKSVYDTIFALIKSVYDTIFALIKSVYDTISALIKSVSETISVLF